jgi:hypothetical protein
MAEPLENELTDTQPDVVESKDGCTPTLEQLFQESMVEIIGNKITEKLLVHYPANIPITTAAIEELLIREGDY